MAGTASLSLPPGALDDDFDPDAHEAAMGAAFGDDYYGEDDADERASRDARCDVCCVQRMTRIGGADARCGCGCDR